jgi:hypothetical protein
MTRRIEPIRPDETWKVFERAHQGNPFLQEDPLYALTEDVIDVIKEHLPRFFTEEQEEFERDLIRRTGAGFFLHKPLGKPTALHYTTGLTLGEYLDYLGLSKETPQQAQPQHSVKQLSPALKPEWFKYKHDQSLLKSLHELLDMFRMYGGVKEKDIKGARRQEQLEERLLLRRAEAYTGWLVTNRQFRGELRELRTTWEKNIARQGGFPRRPEDAGLEAGTKPKVRRDACTKACIAFYRRWCLDRMLSWELPAPLDARLSATENVTSETTPDEGVAIFLPWYLVRGGQFDLQQVVERIRFESAPQHLRAWVSKASERAVDASGEISYQRLYWLYRSYELVLVRRYRAACRNNMETLDRAIGSLMARQEDWVKRLRQRLARDLRDD